MSATWKGGETIGVGEVGADSQRHGTDTMRRGAAWHGGGERRERERGDAGRKTINRAEEGTGRDRDERGERKKKAAGREIESKAEDGDGRARRLREAESVAY